MMDIINKNPNPDKDQLREERQARLENKFFGSLRPKKNHKCYKYNMATGELFELTDEDYYQPELNVVEPLKLYTKPEVDKNGNPFQIGNFKREKIKKYKEPIFKHVRKVKIEPNTYYFTALNETNAITKVTKLFNL